MESPKATTGTEAGGSWLLVILAWTAVGFPLAWGVFMTLKKAALLFK